MFFFSIRVEYSANINSATQMGAIEIFCIIVYRIECSLKGIVLDEWAIKSKGMRLSDLCDALKIETAQFLTDPRLFSLHESASNEVHLARRLIDR